MAVRLATDKDLDALAKLLEGMGQLWSPEAVKDLLTPRWIAVVHEGPEIDGFYVLQCHYDEQPPWGLLGPGDYAPAKAIPDEKERHNAWLRAICEMGLLIEDEVLRRYPKVPIDDCYTLTRIWENMGTLRDTIDTKFVFTQTTDPGAEGYTKTGTLNAYNYKRRYIFEQAKKVLADLGGPLAVSR